MHLNWLAKNKLRGARKYWPSILLLITVVSKLGWGGAPHPLAIPMRTRQCLCLETGSQTDFLRRPYCNNQQ